MDRRNSEGGCRALRVVHPAGHEARHGSYSSSHPMRVDFVRPVDGFGRK